MSYTSISPNTVTLLLDTHTHTNTHISVTLSTPRTPRGMRRGEEKKKKKGNSALGEKLIHVSGIDVGASS